MPEVEPQHVKDARRVIRQWELRNGHAAYAMPLAGGILGYQGACDDCDWLGTRFLRGDEEMGTDESRAHKRNAHAEAATHQQATIPKVVA